MNKLINKTVRFSEEDLAKLSAMPGTNRSEKIRKLLHAAAISEQIAGDVAARVAAVVKLASDGQKPSAVPIPMSVGELRKILSELSLQMTYMTSNLDDKVRGAKLRESIMSGAFKEQK